MCLAIPGQVRAIVGDDPLTRTAKVAFSGIVKEVSLALLPEAGIGDFVLVHAGLAIALLNEAEAMQTIDYLREMGSLGAQSEPRL